MMEADDDTPETNTFPVVLYDGERETNVGNIKIHPDLVFKAFQIKLSQLIGISYNNITTYLVDGKKPKASPDRRKILITGKVNFAVVVTERNCHFFVVLKRSRRDRRRKIGKQSDLSDLSRINWNHHDLNDRFHDLLIQRENLMNLILNSDYGFELRLNSNFPSIEDAYPRDTSKPNRLLCEDCTVAQKQGKIPDFHLCVYDEVIGSVFRSPAGPICRRR
ncbi:hypothetical protein E3N88_32896 [Mikania micrantha]|uniref:DUF7138 domain-containing protein n=1 Tax=Mikania micrantha TaxID=192012 RepID=A0A5N6MAD0_9ASTR|nr:hypothetical protein E3N88_32896 [Mikania micrantha]